MDLTVVLDTIQHETETKGWKGKERLWREKLVCVCVCWIRA